MPDQYQDIMFKLNVLEKCISIYFYAKIELNKKDINQQKKAIIMELLDILISFMGSVENKKISKEKYNQFIDKSVEMIPDIFFRFQKEEMAVDINTNESSFQPENDIASNLKKKNSKNNTNEQSLKDTDQSALSNNNEEIISYSENNSLLQTNQQDDSNDILSDSLTSTEPQYDEFQISHEELLSILNTDLFLFQSNFLPNYDENDIFEGFLVRNIDTVPVLKKMGVIERDIIQSVNDIDFVKLSNTYLETDLIKLFSPYYNLKKSTEIIIKILRNKNKKIMRTFIF